MLTQAGARVCVHASVRSHFQRSRIFFSEDRLANQSEILRGASMGRVNESLIAKSWSHDQDGATPIHMVNTLKNLLLQNRQADVHETWYVAFGTPAHHSLFK